jgi:hypothetical protein
LSKLFITFAIGLVAGLVDIIPMILRGVDRVQLASVFMHWLVTAIFIAYVVMPFPPVAKGALIGLLSALPALITYAASAPARVLPIAAIAVILGGVIGYLTNRFAI